MLLCLAGRAVQAAFQTTSILRPLPVVQRTVPLRACSSAESAEADGVRVNKALRATHSRREADRLVAAGRVTINGVVAEAGSRLMRDDAVHLDGQQVDWKRLNPEPASDAAASSSTFAYVKYWKPRAVVCTTDRRQEANIMDALGALPGVSDRIYPIGRLDADSTGLILLTSDGGIVNGLLRKSERKRKEYVVSTEPRATDSQVQKLARGVVITTIAQSDGRARPLTAPTLPCVVSRARPSRATSVVVGGGGGSGTRRDANALTFVLQEGRNRQIRKMCEVLGLKVRTLHRVGFAGVTLEGCRRPGDWAFLTEEELALLRRSGGEAAGTRMRGQP